MKIPKSYNYIGAFLTYACQLKCSYCINKYLDAKPQGKIRTGAEWVEALNRIETRADLPITLQGGEPTLHPDFYQIVNETKAPIDILTNLQCDIDEFKANISPSRFKPRGKYACIRVSYHPEQMSFKDTAMRVGILHNAGYSIGIWIVDHPKYHRQLQEDFNGFKDWGIDVRWKEFLGYYNGKLYGTYKYPKAMNGNKHKCLCKPSELLIGPDLSLYPCHSHLYNNRCSYGNLASFKGTLPDTHSKCVWMGQCNPCDGKIKNNRFQQWGHSSVDIIVDK